MDPLDVLEAGVYAVLTLVFVGAGTYALVLVFGSALPSFPLSDFLVAAVVVALALAVVFIGAISGS